MLLLDRGGAGTEKRGGRGGRDRGRDGDGGGSGSSGGGRRECGDGGVPLYRIILLRTSVVYPRLR
jgi:hypothetical protein